jgi:hypothetical protein
VLLKEPTSSTWMSRRAERLRVSGNEMPKRADEAIESARSRTSPNVKAASSPGRDRTGDLSWLPSRMVNTPSDIFTARERETWQGTCEAPGLKRLRLSEVYKFSFGTFLFHF